MESFVKPYQRTYIVRSLLFVPVRSLLSFGSQEHWQLREMVRSFVEKEVDPQALEHNR